MRFSLRGSGEDLSWHCPVLGLASWLLGRSKRANSDNLSWGRTTKLQVGEFPSSPVCRKVAKARIACILGRVIDVRKKPVFELDRQGFLDRLAADFPEVVAQIRRDEAGLLHCEVAAFRRAAVEAIDTGKLWAAEKYFKLLEELLPIAGPDLRNALEVSFLEDLAFDKCTPARHRAVKERMPKALRQILIEHHNQWR